MKPIPLLVHLLQDPVSFLGSTVGYQVELDEKEKRRQVCLALIRNAKTFHEWHRAAEELDKLEGNDEWKNDPYSPDYDYELLQSRLLQLEQARATYDVRKILFLIRTSLSRNLGDMGNIQLYQHSHTGTKQLIEDYISCVVSTVSTLLTLSSPNPLRSDPSDPEVSNHEILEALLATRQAFGRTALLFSGGATFGMYHIGVLKALFEANMLPRIISGASAGAIVSSVLCTRTDEELPIVLKEFPHGNMDVFEDSNHPDGVFGRIARFLKTGAFLDIAHLTKVTRELLGDITFAEAHNRTRRILNICVSSTSIYEVPKLLNYITAPNVLIWSAVAASCTVPFVFSSAPILEKDPKTGLSVPWSPSPQKWIDGSVDNDLPIARLSELFNINHFIVSQVNPHIAPFLQKEGCPLDDEQDSFSPWSLSYYSCPHDYPNIESWGAKITKLIFGEVLHRMNMLAEIGIFRTLLTKTRMILSQKYYGDITLLPEVNIQNFTKLLKNPTPEFLFDAMLKGERATWPKLSRIKNHCAVEIVLDKAILHLRAMVVFDPAKQDLRLGYYAGLGPEEKASLKSGQIDGVNEPRMSHVGRRLRVRSSEAIRVTSMAKMNSVIGGKPFYPGWEGHVNYAQAAYQYSQRALPISKSGPNLVRLWRVAESYTLSSHHDVPANAAVSGFFSTRSKAEEAAGVEANDTIITGNQKSDTISSEDGDDMKVRFIAQGVHDFSPFHQREASVAQFEQTMSMNQINQQSLKLLGSKSLLINNQDAVLEPSAKAHSPISSFNNAEHRSACYFTQHPPTAPRHISELMMTPSISSETKIQQPPSPISNTCGPRLEVNSTIDRSLHHLKMPPLLSPALPRSDSLVDLSGTRGMLRRRRSAGQLYLSSVSSDSTSPLRRSPSSISCALANLGRCGMGNSGLPSPGGVPVGGGLMMLGLEKARSAEQLRVNH